jgi:transposase
MCVPHRHQHTMERSTLFQLPKGVQLCRMTVLPAAVRIEATSHRRTSVCPCCQTPSVRVHSTYMRTVADVPWLGRQVTVRLRVRKFRCANPHCPQKVFSERFPQNLRSWARKTIQVVDLIKS